MIVDWTKEISNVRKKMIRERIKEQYPELADVYFDLEDTIEDLMEQVPSFAGDSDLASRIGEMMGKMNIKLAKLDVKLEE